MGGNGSPSGAGDAGRATEAPPEQAAGTEPGTAAPQAPPPAPIKPEPPRLPIVAIGASAGGLEALQTFFAQIPEHCGIGFVVVTHVRPQRQSLLPELLANVTRLRVIESERETRVEPNLVVVAKDSLLTMSNGVLGHADAAIEPEVSHHPIDYFFRELARDQGEHAIGIVLSGSGNDGAVGIQAIKAAGGMAMAQSPESAKYSSMPLGAIDTGTVDFVLPAEALPAALLDYCRGPFLALGRGREPPPLPADAIRTILARLRARTGHDFTCYKKSTVSRRIHRRMHINRIDEPQAYLRFLQEHSEELDRLLQDLLISVTSFFRDADAFAALARQGIPRLLAERGDGETLRVWVAGCATGEEAYSVAILLDEEIRKAGRMLELQLFATDLDARAIEVARHGLYSGAIAADVSPERLAQYFTPEDGTYRIRKGIRDTLVFAVQNLVTDPPFTRMDLVVCRNVLIYLDDAGQRRVVPTLHYALRPGGLLFLGSSESAGSSGELFDVLDSKHKLLRRREGAQALPPGLTVPARPGAAPVAPVPSAAEGVQLARAVERLLLERFAPCSVLVDRQGLIVYLHGRCGLYLEPEQGQPRNNLIDMMREGGTRPLATALAQAFDEQREIVRRDVRVRSNGGHAGVDLTIAPLGGPGPLRGLALVTLQPSVPAPRAPAQPDEAASDAGAREDLERELRFTRESLSSTIEELQTANEELRSSNEELQSTNEELHSSNEELETSREEMQSLNEELNTVNAELQSKLDALTRANDDMRNLLNSTEVATIFLDERLRVKRYTERAREVVRLIESDIGRPLSDLTSTLSYRDLTDDCRRVLDTLVPIEKEVQDTDGRWHLVRLMPYRRADNVIDGLVMTVVSIDRVKQAELAAQAARAHFQSIVQTVREPLITLDGELRVAQANPAFYRTFATLPSEVEGRLVYELGNGQWNIPALRELLERILPERAVIADFRVAHRFPEIGERVFLLNARRLPMPDRGAGLIVVAFEDDTPRGVP